MKIILSVLNILVGVVMLGIYVYVIYNESPGYRLEYAFTWYLPFLLAAIMNFVCGSFSLKVKSWKLAMAGLYIVGLVGIYLLIMWWILRWAMA